MEHCEHIQVSQSGHLLRVEIHRPEKRNAISLAMYCAMAKAFQEADASESVHIVHLTGGAGQFTAGNDLAVFEGARDALPSEILSFMQALMNCSKLVVAEVDGPAVGIGATLLMHCDLVYASPSAFLNFPFVKLGLCPEFGATRLLVQRIGWVKAMELFQLGARLPAEEAQAMGLITRVVSADLGGHVQAVLEQLNQFSPAAVRQTKDLMRQAQEPSVSLQRIIDLELGVFKSLLDQRLAQK
jgi:enoyl-CoA hydratase/carnithine racemase